MDKLWDAPLDTSGTTFNLIGCTRNGTMETKGLKKTASPYEDLVHTLCRLPSCVSAAGLGDDHGIRSPASSATTRTSASVAATASPPARSVFPSTSTTRRPARSASASCAASPRTAIIGLCRGLTGATLFGRTEDPTGRSQAPPGRCWRARSWSCRVLPAQARAKRPRSSQRWKGLVDQSYEAVAGTHLQHVYGEKEYGGTQVSLRRRQFPEGQPARPAAQVLGCDFENHPAHAVRRHDHADCRILA